MTRSREHLDDYAETQVLQPPRAAAPVRDDALVLYEEYAREIARGGAPSTKKPRERRKR